jgi:thiol-disulfide isomerase/thioredoxin
MNRLKQIVISLLFLFLAACTDSAKEYLDNYGNSYQFHQLHGKWVILSYWADWCNTCRKEIKHLNQFTQHYKSSNLLVLGVNFDHLEQDELTKMIKSVGIEYPVLMMDPASELRLGDIPGLPLTVVLAPTGEVYKMMYGEQSEASLLKQIPELNLIKRS